MSFPTVNVTLVPGSEPALIDCGLNTVENLTSLLKALETHGLQPGDITRVLVTHPHVDHIGLASHLADAGAEIWVPEEAAVWLADLAANRARLLGMMMDLLRRHGFEEETRLQVDGFFRSITALFPNIPPERVHPFSLEQNIQVGEYTLTPIAAPGHSNRQVCFYAQENRTLFSADMLLPKTPIPVFEEDLHQPGDRYRGLSQMLASFEKFRSLEAAVIYPGHGEPFTNHAALIDRQVRRIRLRIEECLAHISAGIRSMPGLLTVMYRYLPREERLGGLQMLLGYLDVLMDSGKIREVELDGSVGFEVW